MKPEPVRPVAALFVEKDSIYKTLEGVDCYDIDRNALTWPGGCPAVFHPPCRTWSLLKRWAKAPTEEHGYALWAIEQVRIWGGVLEHPLCSDLWKEGRCGLRNGLPDEWGGVLWSINQYDFGHCALKPTCLYVVGLQEPPVFPPKRSGIPPCTIGAGHYAAGRHIPKTLRSATPPALAVWLVALARSCSSPAGRPALLATLFDNSNTEV